MHGSVAVPGLTLSPTLRLSSFHDVCGKSMCIVWIWYDTSVCGWLGYRCGCGWDIGVGVSGILVCGCMCGCSGVGGCC